jgi:UDP-N-acetylmuramate--alanine ligase
MKKHYFFIGIGGSGMSGLAQIIRAQGNLVSGSDRNYDNQKDSELFCRLQSQDINVYPQNGSGITPHLDEVIVANAIENDNPDLMKVRELSLPVISRSEFLARIFNNTKGIGVAGSSGKSTITAMSARVMDETGFEPTVINGAVIPEYKELGGVGNARLGNSDYMLVETDESDGSLINFYPEIGVLANISKDHKPIPELIQIFSRFVENTKKAVIVNADCPFSRELIRIIPREKVLSFGFSKESQIKAEEVKLSRDGSTFKVQETLFSLKIPGKHNVANALASIALGIKIGIPLNMISRALKKFRGVERRLELVGEVRGIRVYDDFSHNPAKITAAVEALKQAGSRLILIYQPHGFGPTKLLRDELVETFNERLEPTDFLILLDIYYAGGTADKSICSEDLLKGVFVPRAENLHDRDKVLDRIAEVSKPGDIVVVMGARDNTLSDLARSVFKVLKRKEI